MSFSWQNAQEINLGVNTQVVYTPDLVQYGVPEFWADARQHADKGDCEDFAISKLHACIAAGAAPEQLRLCTCWAENNLGYHCVLLIDIDGQTYVMDNRNDDVLPFQDVPYTWDKVQVSGKFEWQKVRAENG